MIHIRMTRFLSEIRRILRSLFRCRDQVCTKTEGFGYRMSRDEALRMAHTLLYGDEPAFSQDRGGVVSRLATQFQVVYSMGEKGEVVMPKVPPVIVVDNSAD